MILLHIVLEMNCFAEELERQISDKKMSQVDLAAKSGISQSQISKWLRAEQTSINMEQMVAIAVSLSNDVTDHASLVQAHLLDEKFGPGSELVRVEIDLPHALKDRPKSRSKGEKALNYLAELRLTNRETNDLLIGLAQALGAKL